jgi:hypothetical protein
MTRRPLAHLVAGLCLIAGTLAITGLGVGALDQPVEGPQRPATASRGHALGVSTESPLDDAVAVAPGRAGEDRRSAGGRVFSVALAAVGALATLAALRRTRSFAAAPQVRPAQLHARRRAPPGLRIA